MPQACAGPGNIGEHIHKVPVFVHRQKVSKQIRFLCVVRRHPRKETTESCPRKCKEVGLRWMVRTGLRGRVAFVMGSES